MPMTGSGKIHKLTLRQSFADDVLPDVHPAWHQDKRASKPTQRGGPDEF
jgi:hypothetical protein